MLKFLVELVGTFVFLAVILKSGGNALAIGIALACVIFFGGDVSGGHFNPAVSFMTYLNNDAFNVGELTTYVVAQLIGASLALVYFKTKK